MTSSASVRIRNGSSHNHNINQHSNCVASSTNLSTSPSGSTSSNCSTSSLRPSICVSSKKLLSPQNNRCSGGNYFSNNNHYQHSLTPIAGSSGKKLKNNNRGTVHVSGSLSPTNFTHYAGSKCFEAPAPTALPKPPQHWTEITSKASIIFSSKRHVMDDFNTHNLKLLLNVQS